VERLGLENRVSCLGNRTDVAELLAESDIFVLSTKWEGLPVSILEAMRAGLPIVATDVGGVAEMVKDGEQGFLTRRGDAEQLRDRIQCLVDSPTLRAKMGASARAKFAADFQMETCIRKHVALYRRCLAKAHKEAALETEPAA
jgi:glycosyltransferase involved in cell wall biosynthesis